ncbi:MAG TPA: tetratricopeptide repeat protein, partial [Acidimicrobiales bacterium]
MTAAVSYVGQARTDAERALGQAFADPRRSIETARAALAAARTAHDPFAESLAHQALGLAARLLGQVTTAVARLETSVATAEQAGLALRAAEARISLSLALTMAGRTSDALASLDAAARSLHGVKLAQLRAQRALILRRLGRLDEAFDELRRALPTLRRAGDHLLVARALNERGLLQVDRGAFAAADADLRRSQELFRSLGQLRDAAATGHNRGWCAARAGDVVAALRLYDEAEADFAHLGIVMGEVPLDRARVLLAAGLATDARDLATRAAEVYEASADRAGWAEAMLAVAEAALAAGDAEGARQRAMEAKRAFAQQRRPGWQALARYLEARAAWGAGDRSAAAYQRVRKVAADLETLGLPLLASEALLIAGRTAAALDRPGAAHDALVRASRSRGGGPAQLRGQGWLAEALLRLQAGRGSSAEAALRAGLGVLDAHRTSLGATELRANASRAAAELATLGLRLAVESGRPRRVLAWTERWRAGSLAMRPVRPPEDRAVAAALGELRGVLTEIERAGTAGRPTAELVARQAALEETVRRLSHRAAGGGNVDAARVPSADELVGALGDRALIELVEVNGKLLAVVVARGRVHLADLGRHSEAVAEMDGARFALRRLAHGRGSPASLAAASGAVAHAGRRLEAQVVSPLRRWIADRPVVIVPPASLHALPWSIV